MSDSDNREPQELRELIGRFEQEVRLNERGERSHVGDLRDQLLDTGAALLAERDRLERLVEFRKVDPSEVQKLMAENAELRKNALTPKDRQQIRGMIEVGGFFVAPELIEKLYSRSTESSLRAPVKQDPK